MNGINAPKQIACLGSDGENYRQLAKSGNDDLRQDAVRKDDFYMTVLCLCNRTT
jgi:serine-protein kinase ATM